MVKDSDENFFNDINLRINLRNKRGLGFQFAIYWKVRQLYIILTIYFTIDFKTVLTRINQIKKANIKVCDNCQDLRQYTTLLCNVSIF